MGTGKSTLGSAVATLLGRPWVDSDLVIEAEAGRRIPEIFAAEGEEGFRQRETAALATLAATGGKVLTTGGGALGRPANLALLRLHGVVVALRARPEVILRRVGGAQAARQRPLLAGEDPLARIGELLAKREHLYAQADLMLDTSDLSRSAAVRGLLALVARRAGEVRRG